MKTTTDYRADIKRAMRGLSAEDMARVVRKKDGMYDAARAEGMTDAEATTAAYESAIALAKKLKAAERDFRRAFTPNRHGEYA